MDALLPENDPHAEVYDLLVTALTHLSRFESGQYLLRFKKKLLHLLGYWDSGIPDNQIDSYIESIIGKSLKTNIQTG